MLNNITFKCNFYVNCFCYYNVIAVDCHFNYCHPTMTIRNNICYNTFKSDIIEIVVGKCEKLHKIHVITTSLE